MGDLSELTLRTSYHRGEHDIAHEFYLPCMNRAAEYDRAVGYFRSTVFIIAWPALRGFVARGARMRILCSQVLADEDVKALEVGYAARADAALAVRLREEVQQLLDDPVLQRPARVLAALVSSGFIELQIAVIKASDHHAHNPRIFHDKLGLFRDERSNIVVFKGSMNETWSGLSSDGNIESVDVAASWMGARDLERTRNEQRYFNALWSRRYPGLSIRPFPEVAREEFRKASDPTWDDTVQALLSEQQRKPSIKKENVGRTLHSHQAAGLASWAANDRHGILAFATGSGKTFTAITALREALTRFQQPALIVVPDQVLFDQWYSELSKEVGDLAPQILRAGAGHADWRGHVRAWTAPGEQRRIVLATLQTAADDEFRNELKGGEHLLLIADEVHRLGSPRNRRLLDETLFGPRLGLSATPERYGDPAGTGALLDFFRGILEPRYTLRDAIREGVLTPYFYRPHAIDLEPDEAERWRSLTRQISRAAAQVHDDRRSEGLERRIKLLLLRRAQIVKQARAKVRLAVEILRNVRSGERWIVYCDDQRQLNAVTSGLDAEGVVAMPFHSGMQGDRAETLRWLDRRGGVVVAIRCLDEGVDVPAVSHALILASSKNPREFIQRRGRVLRRAPGKALAYLHDAIVLPPQIDREGEDEAPDPITVGEFARALSFGENAANAGASADLQRIAIELGLDWRSLVQVGVEDEDE